MMLWFNYRRKAKTWVKRKRLNWTNSTFWFSSDINWQAETCTVQITQTHSSHYPCTRTTMTECYTRLQTHTTICRQHIHTQVQLNRVNNSMALQNTENMKFPSVCKIHKLTHSPCIVSTLPFTSSQTSYHSFFLSGSLIQFTHVQ